MFEGTGGWGLERAFSKWANNQRWRKCLPTQFWENFGSMTAVQFFRSYNAAKVCRAPRGDLICPSASSPAASRVPQVDVDWGREMTPVKIAVMLPHEMFASLWNFQNGHLFHSLLTGTPDEPWLQLI